MLLCGKEAGNRKQEIDCQHHIILNKRTKESIMESLSFLISFRKVVFYSLSPILP